jgi:cyclic-di-AMP phosphodiesterase PgpH
MPEHNGKNQDQHTLTYLSKLGINLFDSLVKRVSNPLTARRNRLILLVVTAIILTFIILPGRHLRMDLKAGDIATSDIRASRDHLVEDQAMTDLRRKEAGNLSPVVYNLSDRVPGYITDKIGQTLSLIRKEKDNIDKTDHEQWIKLLSPLLDTELTKEDVAVLTSIRSENAFLSDLTKLLNDLYSSKIVLDGTVFLTDLRRGVEITDNKGAQIGHGSSSTSYIEISEARNIIKKWKFNGLGNKDDSSRITSILSRILLPNFYFNQEASVARGKSAVDAVRPVMFKVQKGEMIVRVGERISPDQALKIQAEFQGKDHSNILFTACGIFTMILVLFYFPYRFALKNIRKFNPSNKDILVIFILITCSLLVSKTALLISQNIGSVFPRIDPENYYFLLPFAAGGMILRVFINSEVALVYCAVMAPLFGILFDNSMFVVIYALLSGIVGAHGIRQCTDRSTIYTAGMKIAVVNVALAISFQTFSNSLFSVQTLYISFFALLSGLLSSVLASGFIPVIEMLFHYTTDIKLLELANLNSPLLKELMLRAPGTYHHSVMVGNLVEGAAEAVNANPLLARVAAYYHDIGKTSKPQYFIENQAHDDNRHDKLTPSMSALILISHIKEGAEMAREKHLGQPIIDIIRQHHGTALIKFFYNRARMQAEANGQTVDEKNFRYPGPKPQTREAGIVMLADCVEAASRTLTNPTPDRIQGMVQKIINNIFIDGQLDECELTLKNLHEIAKSFNITLNAIFHHRIDYPEPVHKGQNSTRQQARNSSGGKNKISIGESSENNVDQPPAAAQSSGQRSEKSSGEDLKRLGMS